jgi:hypothetical protein
LKQDTRESPARLHCVDSDRGQRHGNCEIAAIRTSEIINEQASMNFQVSSESLDVGSVHACPQGRMKKIRMKPENSLMLVH